MMKNNAYVWCAGLTYLVLMLGATYLVICKHCSGWWIVLAILLSPSIRR